MVNKRLNNMIFIIEVTVYGCLGVLFLCLGYFRDLSEELINAIYIMFMRMSFGYLFLLEFVLKKYDNAVHFKAFEKYYVPTGRSAKQTYRRKGIGAVLLLWAAYLAFAGFLKKLGVLSWHVFLACACLMFILNSIFARKKCLLSVLFMHNKNDCCKNCGINSWDYAIFASALIFAPHLSLAATLTNWIIITASIVILVVWEINYRKYPYRFYPETNKTLSCSNCMKQCKYRNKR